MDRAFLLRCAVKTYEWGKLGLNSSVAQLYKSAFQDFEVLDSTPYAELWMGTHPSGPSIIPSLNKNLLDWIIEHSECLGTNISKNFCESGLPFLFKVLSVRKALSIQAHPDKQTAEQLHSKFKDIYPDNNHKPEMAIALTEFHALCGFRPVAEINAFITELPQIRTLIGNENAVTILNAQDADQNLMKLIFSTVITRKEKEFQPLLINLVNWFEKTASLSDLCKSVKEIFLKVHHEYPGDIGCFCIFFFNYMVLQPGEAIFLAANEPHAYLQGDCIECMACSDNVVRAGLTPKFKDVNTLCDILTYKCKLASENIFPYVTDDNDAYVKIYDPPVKEFTVAKIEVPSQNNFYHLKILKSASILIVIDGNASAVVDETKKLDLCKGSILFIACQTKVDLQVLSSKILMFRAYCDV